MERNTKIYGRSDDLIEVEGAADGELYANYGEPTTFRVGDFKLKAEYSDMGEWLFEVVDNPHGLSWTHLNVGNEVAPVCYTQVVRVDVPSGATVEKLD